MPIVTWTSYNKSIIEIPRVGQYGEIFHSIVPPFGRADAVNLEWNISLYYSPSHAIIYVICLRNLPKLAETTIGMS